MWLRDSESTSNFHFPSHQMKTMRLCLNSPIKRLHRAKIQKFSSQRKKRYFNEKRIKDSPYQEMIPQIDVSHIIFMTIEYSKFLGTNHGIKDTNLFLDIYQNTMIRRNWAHRRIHAITKTILKIKNK